MYDKTLKSSVPFEFQATPNNNLMKKIFNKFSMALLAFAVTTGLALAQNNLMVVGAVGDPGFENETPLGKLPTLRLWRARP